MRLAQHALAEWRGRLWVLSSSLDLSSLLCWIAEACSDMPGTMPDWHQNIGPPTSRAPFSPGGASSWPTSGRFKRKASRYPKPVKKTFSTVTSVTGG